MSFSRILSITGVVCCSHPLVTQDGKSFQKLSSAYSSHGPGATTSFFTRSTVVLPVPRTELQDSFPQNPAPSMTADALKSAVTLQSAPTLPTAESVDDPLLQASKSGAPRVVQDSPFGASRKNTVRAYLLFNSNALITAYLLQPMMAKYRLSTKDWHSPLCA